MYAWKITVHEDSSGKEDTIRILPHFPFVSIATDLHPERLSAPKDHVVAIVSDRVRVCANLETAKRKEPHARFYDDEGNRLF